MGCSPSQDKNPSRQSSDQARQNLKRSSSSSTSSRSSSSSTKSSKYKERSVYYLKMEVPSHPSEIELAFYEVKRVTEMTVCKRGYADHWFVALKVHMSDSQIMHLALHYNNIGTVVIKEFKEETNLEKTSYYPNKDTNLKLIIQLCLSIVQEKPYNLVTYNCQTVVTKVMEPFTGRQVNRFYSMLKIPIKANMSKPLSSSFRGSQLEKEFLEKYEKDGLDAALSELEQQNESIENTIRNLAQLLVSPQKELEEFKEKPLTQNYDSKLINQLKNMENNQTNTNKKKIVCQFARSIYLSNTICSINFAASLNTDASSNECLAPEEMLEREASQLLNFSNYDINYTANHSLTSSSVI